jgi:hypothetical protein
MKTFFVCKKIHLFLLVTFLFVAIIIFWQKYPFGVRRYKTITIGMPAAEKAGDQTGWAPPYNQVFKESNFFIYSLGDSTMCVGSDCGMGGYFVECLNGWVSGYKDIGDVFDYGLREVGVDINKKKIITIADKNGKIVGIYPNASVKNIPYIMRNHRDLFSEEVFKGCWSQLPSHWE